MSGEQGSTAAAHKVVFVHVGAPKTGTTYLQNVLWKNRDELSADGLCYPLQSPMEHLAAALDLRQMPWAGKHNPAREGAWERVAARVRAWTGPVAVISNELLGGVTDKQARQAVESLQPAEVHVVFTARDLARQLPSDWQEHLKHRHTVTFEKFVDDLIERGIDAPRPFGEMFWGLHDAVRVLGNWSAALPPERIHLVTVPHPGAPKGLLWQRFATLLGVDPARYDTEITGSNTSIGQAEAEFLRRLNLVLGKQRLGERYDPLVRVGLAEGILARRPDQRRIMLGQDRHEWVRRRSEEIIQGVRAGGYDVIGDLDELLPGALETAQPHQRPGDTAVQELFDVAVDAVAGVLERPAPPRGRERALEQRVAQLEGELEQRRRQPFKSALRDASHRRGALMRLRVLWWRIVEWSRRARGQIQRAGT